MIEITKRISIDEKEIQEHFVRASGPGGQNVNKVSTAVQLRFNVKKSPSLPEDVRRRLLSIAGNKITDEGILVIDARKFRHQERNRKDALERLKKLIFQATQKPKTRHRTKPTRSSVEKRLEVKRRRQDIKRSRKPVKDFD